MSKGQERKEKKKKNFEQSTSSGECIFQALANPTKKKKKKKKKKKVNFMQK